MTAYIALLRGINVGGRNMVPMAALRELAEALGLSGPRTLLQSGNLVFRSKATPPAKLEQRLEQAVTRRFGLAVDFMVRSADEWREAIDANPLRREAERDPGHFIVLFMKDAPAAKDVAALQAAVPGREMVRVVGRHGYLVFPDGMGRSKLAGPLTERTLRTRGTGRNWNTVLKLASLVGG